MKLLGGFLIGGLATIFLGAAVVASIDGGPSTTIDPVDINTQLLDEAALLRRADDDEFGGLDDDYDDGLRKTQDTNDSEDAATGQPDELPSNDATADSAEPAGATATNDSADSNGGSGARAPAGSAATNDSADSDTVVKPRRPSSTGAGTSGSAGGDDSADSADGGDSADT